MRTIRNPKTTTRAGRSNWLARQEFAGSWITLGQVVLESQDGLRRHSRYATRNLTIESPVYGWAVNVSESGLCLESLTGLVIGAEYVFRLRYGSSFLSLPGRVAWSRVERNEITRSGSVEVHQGGIELDLNGSGKSWLEAVGRLTGACLRA